MIEILNYIDGEFSASKSRKTISTFNPSTGQAYATLPDSNQEDINKAVLAAQKAFPAWSKTSIQERSSLLMAISKLIEDNLEELAEAESRDNGKPLWLAQKVDIPRAAANFHFFASAIEHFASESHHMEREVINYTLRQPLGVVGCISPWNLPLYLFSWKIAPALAAGNCVIGKPSEITPMTAFMLAKLCDQAGLPKGVLNIVHGTGINTGNAMVEHPHIKAISFTGGTSTGKEIARKAAPMFKKLSLELGGKNPTVIFEDCDFEKAVKTAVKSSFTNQGQICLCGSRILIQQSIYDKFTSHFLDAVNKLRVGNPEEKNDLGAIISEAHFHKVLSYIELAQQEGGKILAGGKSIKLTGALKGGWYIQPTVIEGLSPQCRVNQEEIFGPVVSLMPFSNEEEALSIANNSDYGLAANIWTNDLQRAHRLAEKIQTGIVWVNCWLLRDLRTPFGGMKSSGVGREGGWEALRFFTEPKNVCIRY